MIIGIETEAVWKTIPWAPRYQVSNTGAVRKSINRSSDHRHRNRPWLYLKPEKVRDGHLRFCLTVDGVSSRHFAHRLVYEMFVGDLKRGLVVCHWDNNPENNRPDNLVQSTQLANMQHKQMHGTQAVGEDHHRSLISNAVAAKIKAALGHAKRGPSGRLRRGELARIANKYCVAKHTVHDIMRGRRSA